MRRFITAATAIAALAVPSIALVAPSMASANVPRCAAPVTGPTTATFQVTSPVTEGDWTNVWNHDFTVTVQPDGSFTGTDQVYNGDPSTAFTETDSGKFVTNPKTGTTTVSLTANRPFDYVNSWSLSNAVMDGQTIADATTQPVVPWQVEMKVTAPAMTTDLNHGQYVSSQGGGKVAAQSCAGMPLNSTQG